MYFRMLCHFKNGSRLIDINLILFRKDRISRFLHGARDGSCFSRTGGYARAPLRNPPEKRIQHRQLERLHPIQHNKRENGRPTTTDETRARIYPDITSLRARSILSWESQVSALELSGFHLYQLSLCSFYISKARTGDFHSIF